MVVGFGHEMSQSSSDNCVSQANTAAEYFNITKREGDGLVVSVFPSPNITRRPRWVNYPKKEAHNINKWRYRQEA